MNLLSDRNYEESKKWGVTFKKVPKKSSFFWCFDLLNLDGQIDRQIGSKYIIQKCSYLVSLIDDKKKNSIILNIFYISYVSYITL